MKHIIRKAFWSNEKEEKWLNEMAARGLAMSDYSWCRYVFEESERGEYCYRIELLEHPVNHPESIEYIKFVEESGAEFVANYMKWVYFRRKLSEGEFELYSDLDSKIIHTRRIISLWNFLVAAEFGAGGINVLLGTIFWLLEGVISVNIIIGIPLIGLGFLFLSIRRPIIRRLRFYQKEKQIRE